jgi:Mrp family chromosome partitioning ATPase
MSGRRFAVVSGFLGAGKTTTMIALANELKSRGVKDGDNSQRPGRVQSCGRSLYSQGRDTQHGHCGRLHLL